MDASETQLDLLIDRLPKNIITALKLLVFAVKHGMRDTLTPVTAIESTQKLFTLDEFVPCLVNWWTCKTVCLTPEALQYIEDALTAVMQMVYYTEESVVAESGLETGLMVATTFECDAGVSMYFRAKIVTVDNQRRTALVEFSDWGNRENVCFDRLKPLFAPLHLIPPLMYRAVVNGARAQIHRAAFHTPELFMEPVEAAKHKILAKCSAVEGGGFAVDLKLPGKESLWPYLSDSETCAICLENLYVLRQRYTPCGHRFCYSCLRKAKKEQENAHQTVNGRPTCPVCRNAFDWKLQPCFECDD
jgi:hypothetical protein